MSEYDSDAMDKAIPIDIRRNTKKKTVLGGRLKLPHEVPKHLPPFHIVALPRLLYIFESV